MRFALWLLALFAVATAGALFASANPGTVSIFFPPHRLDVSLNLFVVVLVAFVAIVHLTLISLSGLLGMPQAARAWRKHQRERAAVQALADGAAHFLAGRFARAVRDAHAAAAHAQAYQADPFDDGFEHGEGNHAQKHQHPVLPLAHWLAAEAHHALQNLGARNEALLLAERSADAAHRTESLREGLGLRAARFALDDRDPNKALAILQGLSAGVRRRTAALRMQLRAARLSGASQQALDVARMLAKHRAFSPQVSLSLRSALASDVLQRSGDIQTLLRHWKSLDSQEQAMPEVVCVAAATLQRLSAHATTPDQLAQHRLQARSWLVPFIQRWADLQDRQRTRIVPLMFWALHDSADEHSGQREHDTMAILEATLLHVPNDAVLHHLCGLVFEQRKLWGKAQRAFDRAAAGLNEESLRRSNWLALARLAQERGDEAATKLALSKAASG